MSLNFIPSIDGGAGGAIPTDRVVPGIASEKLCSAIQRFQQRYFPQQQTGFVDPSGTLLPRLVELASRQSGTPVPASPLTPPDQWGQFKSSSVQNALRAALADTHFLSHVMIVEILRDVISNGIVGSNELADLQMLLDHSNSIMPRSKTMLAKFVKDANENIAKLGPYRFKASAIFAANRVCDFLKLQGKGRWPLLDRDQVGVGILVRLAYPGLLRQGDANLCGPAAMLFTILLDHPAAYAVYAMDLYEHGRAKLGKLLVEPGDSIRKYYDSGKLDAVDWLTMGSLRSSENWFLADGLGDPTGEKRLGEQREGLFGATTQLEMAWWFDRAGYHDIKQEANLTRHQRDTSNMDEASRLFAAGYRVCLLIDGQLIDTTHQSESGSKWLLDRHWIVLRSEIDRSGGDVKMHIFTWGDGNRAVPTSGTLPLDNFLTNYYGYVAALP
ncbi:MAG: hypothetical protein ABJA10_02975 [Aestuariivirga sp.]